MDKKLHKTKNTFSIIDDILVVTKGTKEEHMVTVEETNKAMDEAGIRDGKTNMKKHSNT